MHEFILLASLQLVLTPLPINDQFVNFDNFQPSVRREITQSALKALSIDLSSNNITTHCLNRSFVLLIPGEALTCQALIDGARSQIASSEVAKLNLDFPLYILDEFAANISTRAIANPVAFRLSCTPIHDNTLARAKSLSDQLKKVFALVAIVAIFVGIIVSNRLF